MNVHEYQAKQLFREYGIPVMEGRLAESGAAAEASAAELGCPVVIKAQIHAGGRGKAGGVKTAQTPREARAVCDAMIGSVLRTRQSGPEGKLVRKVYIEKCCELVQEYYLSMTIDPAAERVVIIASEAGGMSIEEVAEESPEKVITVQVDPILGLRSFNAYYLADKIKLPENTKKEFVQVVSAMYRLFTEKECMLLEINPLGLTAEGRLIALDAKADFDAGALYRHPDIAALYDKYEVTELEARAAESGITYVPIYHDGEVGCLVGGAGMGMSTLDTIVYLGGRPRNFMDFGGSHTTDDICEAMAILKTAGVKGIFCNFFAGLNRMDLVAEDIIEAIHRNKISLPVVVRLDGNSAEKAQAILRSAGIPNMHVASCLREGAQMILDLIREAEV